MPFIHLKQQLFDINNDKYVVLVNLSERDGKDIKFVCFLNNTFGFKKF